jgi:MtN3 and saliva related transmembrane protein
MTWVFVSGLIAAFCTTISFLPQAIKTIQTRDTSSISLNMYLLFTFGTLMWLLYGLFSHNLPVTLANSVTLVLSSVILYYKLQEKKPVVNR